MTCIYVCKAKVMSTAYLLLQARADHDNSQMNQDEAKRWQMSVQDINTLDRFVTRKVDIFQKIFSKHVVYCIPLIKGGNSRGSDHYGVNPITI